MRERGGEKTEREALVEVELCSTFFSKSLDSGKDRDQRLLTSPSSN